MRRMWMVGVLTVVASVLAPNPGPRSASASSGGPVLIDGTDSGFHGSSFQGALQGGWQYQLRWYQLLLAGVPGSYVNNGKVAVVGATSDAVSLLQNCGAAATQISQQLGVQADFYEGSAAISSLFASVLAGSANYKLIHIVEEPNYVPASAGCSNGMSSDEVAAVDSAADAIAAHVNRGGGLFA